MSKNPGKNPFLSSSSSENPFLANPSKNGQASSMFGYPQVPNQKPEVLNDVVGRGDIFDNMRVRHSSIDNNPQMENTGSMNGEENIDMDLPVMIPQGNSSAIFNRGVPIDQSHHFESDLDVEEVSLVHTGFPSSDQPSPSADNTNRGNFPTDDPHSDLLEILGLEPNIDNDVHSQDLPAEGNSSLRKESAIDDSQNDIPDHGLSSQPNFPSSDHVENSDQNALSHSKKEGNFNVENNQNGSSEDGASHDETERGEEASVFLSAVAKGKMPESIQDGAGEENSDPTSSSPAEMEEHSATFLDERQRRYSGKVKDSTRNKPMRPFELDKITKKNSRFIKPRFASTIHAKIPDMLILAGLTRTKTQLFFAFLYLLTQRTWSDTLPELMENKMGFWEEIHPRLDYPSSVRHLTTKAAFLRELDRIMVAVAYQNWQPAEKGQEWDEPGVYDDFDTEYPEFNDITIPYITWYKREDHELLALTDLLLGKTERDQRIDRARISRNNPPTRLSMRARVLLRLVQDPPDELLEKIKELQCDIDELANKLAADDPENLTMATNEEDFIDRHTYYLPKPAEELAKLAAAEKERLELEKLNNPDYQPEQGEDQEDSPKSSKPKRVKVPSSGMLTCARYPIPPSMTMVRQAQRNGQEAKRPVNLVKYNQKSSKSKKKKRSHENDYERPVRASKKRASEKLSQSYAEYEQFSQVEQDAYMDGVEEDYNDMEGCGEQQDQVTGNSLSHQNSFYEPSGDDSEPEWEPGNGEEGQGEDYETPPSQEPYENEGEDVNSTQTSFPHDGTSSQEYYDGYGHLGSQNQGYGEQVYGQSSYHPQSNPDVYRQQNGFAGHGHLVSQNQGYGDQAYGPSNYLQSSSHAYQQQARFVEHGPIHQTYQNWGYSLPNLAQQAHQPFVGFNNPQPYPSQSNHVSEEQDDIKIPVPKYPYHPQQNLSQHPHGSPYPQTPTQPLPINSQPSLQTPQISNSSPEPAPQATPSRAKRLTIKFVKRNEGWKPAPPSSPSPHNTNQPAPEPASFAQPPTQPHQANTSKPKVGRPKKVTGFELSNAAKHNTNSAAVARSNSQAGIAKKRKRTSEETDFDFDFQDIVEPEDDEDDDYEPDGGAKKKLKGGNKGGTAAEKVGKSKGGKKGKGGGGSWGRRSRR